MGYFLLGFALLVGFLLIARWYTTADVRTLLNALRWVAIGLLGMIALFLLVSGRLGLALGAAAFLLPWAMRALRQAGPSGFSGSGQGHGAGERASTIRTRFLHMSLDHASGRLDGEIIDGPQAGRRLGELAREALISLLGEYHRQDPQSAQLLEAYLDRMDPQWREAGGARQAMRSGGRGSVGRSWGDVARRRLPRPWPGSPAPRTARSGRRIIASSPVCTPTAADRAILPRKSIAPATSSSGR